MQVKFSSEGQGKLAVGFGGFCNKLCVVVFFLVCRVFCAYSTWKSISRRIRYSRESSRILEKGLELLRGNSGKNLCQFSGIL